VDVAIILNRSAGSATTVDLDGLAGALAPLGRVGTVPARADEGPTEQLARGLEAGATTLIAAGGDGTVSGLVNALDARGLLGRVRLGVIPLGTGNDLARSLGLPMDPLEAAAVLARGVARRLDLLRLCAADCADPARRVARLVLNASTAGFGSLVAEHTGDGAKRALGALAYAASAVSEAASAKLYCVRVRADHSEAFRTTTYHLVVCNGRTIGGGVPVSPASLLDDGLLDLTITPGLSAAELAVLVAKALGGRHGPEDGIITRSARTLDLESDPPLPLNADGDLLGTTPARYKVLPRAAEFLIGPEAGVAGSPARE